MGDALQVLLWGVLASHATHFAQGSLWPTLSARIRMVVYFVIFLATLSTATAISDFWRYGTSGIETYERDRKSVV